jgi:hypothetical protein
VTEATEAPATTETETNDMGDTNQGDINPGDIDRDIYERTEAAIAAFRSQLEGQVSVPASVVQDGLLDLWGLLPEGDIRSVVEHWLTETLERNLYSVTDVDSRLEAVLAHQE